MFDLTLGDIRRDWKTLPNLISLARLVIFTPLAVVLILHSAGWWAIAVVAAGSLSDLIDGKLAKRNNGALMTKTGKVLDPVSDKVFVWAVMVAIILVKAAPLQTHILVAFGAIALLDGITFALRAKQPITSALQAGRVAMVVRSAVVVLLLLPVALPDAAYSIGLWLAVAASAFATLAYARSPHPKRSV